MKKYLSLGIALAILPMGLAAERPETVSATGDPTASSTTEIATTETDSVNNDSVNKDTIFECGGEQQAEFPGGLPALMRFLANNIRYPIEAQKAKAEGKVVVRFVVKKDGTIGDVTVLKSIHPALDAEAIRIIKMMPAWQPGLMNGEPVNSYFTLPVSFSFNQPEKKE